MSDMYIGLMGVLSNMTKINVHSNNVANAETNGYKKDSETFKVFEENKKIRFYKDERANIGGYHDKVYVDEIHTNFSVGSMRQTASEFDFSLEEGIKNGATSFFVVKMGDETYVTRNGNFKLNENRELTTMNGANVLNQNGETIVIPKDATISTNSSGIIMNLKNNEAVSTLQIRTIQKNDLGLLEKKTGGLFQVMNYEKIQSHFGNIGNIINEFDRNKTIRDIFGTKERLENIRNTQNVQILGEFSGKVNERTLESSNVDLTNEMVEILKAQKHLQANQKTISIMDKILTKEANDLTR